MLIEVNAINLKADRTLVNPDSIIAFGKVKHEKHGEVYEAATESGIIIAVDKKTFKGLNLDKAKFVALKEAIEGQEMTINRRAIETASYSAELKGWCVLLKGGHQINIKEGEFKKIYRKK